VGAAGVRSLKLTPAVVITRHRPRDFIPAVVHVAIEVLFCEALSCRCLGTSTVASGPMRFLATFSPTPQSWFGSSGTTEYRRYVCFARAAKLGLVQGLAPHEAVSLVAGLAGIIISTAGMRDYNHLGGAFP
jgi:hypothetical protein